MEQILVVSMIFMLVVMIAMGLVIRILFKALLEQIANEWRRRIKYGSTVAIMGLALSAIGLLIQITNYGNDTVNREPEEAYAYEVVPAKSYATEERLETIRDSLMSEMNSLATRLSNIEKLLNQLK